MALTKHAERLDGLNDRPRALFIPKDPSPCVPPNPTEGKPHLGAAEVSGIAPHGAAPSLNEG